MRENSVSSSSQVPKGTGKPVALFSRKSSPEHQQVEGNNEPLFRFSDPKEATRSFLEERLQKQNLKCESKNAEQIFSTLLFVIFRHNLIPIAWKSIVPIMAVKNHEKSRPDFMKNSSATKEYFEKLRSEVFMKWVN